MSNTYGTAIVVNEGAFEMQFQICLLSAPVDGNSSCYWWSSWSDYYNIGQTKQISIPIGQYVQPGSSLYIRVNVSGGTQGQDSSCVPAAIGGDSNTWTVTGTTMNVNISSAN